MIDFNYIESLAEQLIEGTFGRVFGSPLHLSQLVRKLARVMEDQQRAEDGPMSVFPNRYWVFLSPGDYGVLCSDQKAFQTVLRRVVLRLADDMGGKIEGPLSISARPVKEMTAGQLDVRAAFVTQSYVPGTTHETETIHTPPASARWTLKYEGHIYCLGEPVVRLGRALNNDIILDDLGVSRYHAQLRWREGRYHISDLESRGGVVLNNRKLLAGEEVPLSTGDVIRLSDTLLSVGREKG